MSTCGQAVDRREDFRRVSGGEDESGLGDLDFCRRQERLRFI